MQALSQLVTAKTKNMLASGISQTETAAELGISRKSANRISQANRQEIEQLALQYIQDSIPLIRDNHIKTLKIANYVLSQTLPDTDKPDIEAIEAAKTILTLADKKEYRGLLTMGIVPSHTPSVVVNQLFATGNITLVDPGVKAALQGYTDDLFDDDVQEAEVEPSQSISTVKPL